MNLAQWRAIKNRDRAYDGVFYYGMKTTGTVCRPSCSKKSCLPENVVIFTTLEEALKQGYKPCKRCKPELPDWKGPKVELANAAAELIEKNYLEPFSLEKLAGKLNINKFYLLRIFGEVKGQTLLAYHNQVRCAKAKELLARPELSMSCISQLAGYNSPSHFSRIFKKTTGMTPSQYRRSYSRQLYKETE